MCVSSTAEQHIHQVKQRQDDKERREILDWLTPADYGPQQSDYINRRQPGTSKWLLDSAKYQAWLLGALSGTPFLGAPSGTPFLGALSVTPVPWSPFGVVPANMSDAEGLSRPLSYGQDQILSHQTEFL
jgi:hypothetical protein